MESESPKQENNNQKPVVSTTSEKRGGESLHAVKHVTAWIMILSATIFALIGVLAVWQVFGSNAQDVVWRAFVSLVIISFAALIANLGASIPKSK